MKVKEGLITPDYHFVDHDSHCADCFERLRWESHNSGEIQGQYWVAFCACNNHQRLWYMRIATVKFESING